MKTAIALLTPTYWKTHFEFATVLPEEGDFYVSNGDEELTGEDMGKYVLVHYSPQDQFCKVITMDVVENALSVRDIITIGNSYET